MRLAALALVATLASAGPGWAGPKCMAHVHSGAPAFQQEGDFGPMKPAVQVGPHMDYGAIDDEVYEIDKFTSGGPWIIRLHGPAYRRIDVDLRGDCSHLNPH